MIVDTNVFDCVSSVSQLSEEERQFRPNKTKKITRKRKYENTVSQQGDRSVDETLGDAAELIQKKQELKKAFELEDYLLISRISYDIYNSKV